MLLSPFLKLFVESYVTFDSLQRISIVEAESNGVM